MGFQCLTGDEAFTILNWTESLNNTFSTIALIDPQPPGALLAFSGWIKLAGHTELAARYLSVLAGALTTAVVYAIGRQVGNKRTALLAAFLWSISPYQIWHAQNARNYALWGCFSLLSIWFLIRELKRPNHLPTWVAYTLITTLALYTFYLEALQIIAQNLLVLFLLLTSRRNRHLLRNWIVSQTAVVLLLVPWLIANPRLLLDSGYSPTGSTTVEFLNFVRTITLGETLPPSLQTNAAAIISLAVLVVVLVSVVRRLNRFGNQLGLFMCATSPLLLALLTIVTRQGYWRPHYLHASAGVYILVIALSSAKPIGKLAVIATAALSFLGLTHYYFNPEAAKAPDWRSLVAYLDSQADPEDLIVITYPDPSLDYYYDGPADHAILPVNQYDPIENTAPHLLDALATHRRIWLLPVQNPYWDRDRTVQRWLNNNAQFISERYVEQFRIRQYASWEAADDEIDHLLNVDLGGLVTLVGYNISTFSSFPGDEVTIELYWLPTTQSETSMTVFTHLLGSTRPDGSILWAQDDHPPRNWRADTTTWETDVLLRDVYHIVIPPDAPPGEYMLTTGFYDPATGDRLLIEGADAPTEDSIIVTTLTVTQ